MSKQPYFSPKGGLPSQHELLTGPGHVLVIENPQAPG